MAPNGQVTLHCHCILLSPMASGSKRTGGSDWKVGTPQNLQAQVSPATTSLPNQMLIKPLHSRKSRAQGTGPPTTMQCWHGIRHAHALQHPQARPQSHQR